MSTYSISQRYLQAKRTLFDKKFSKLNDKQREAVYYINGPLLVLAGAGTGKTTLLVNRIAYILNYGDSYNSDYIPQNLSEETVKELEDAVDTVEGDTLDLLLNCFAKKRVNPWNVLSITFTNKAANEMKTRLKNQIGEEAAANLWCGTFHSMCLRILRANAPAMGWSSSFTIYDVDDQKKIMSKCMEDLKIDEKMLPVKLVLSTIGRLKDTLTTPAEYYEEVKDGFDVKLIQIAKLYSRYQEELSKANAVDFDDIIMKTVFMLRQCEEVRTKYQNQFEYVLIDEFQDTNFAQFELAKLLSAGKNNLMVVGDDDQSIYKFRGATIENILRFDENIKNANIIKLEENYRSTSNILGAANSVIRHNYGRRGKELWTHADSGSKIVVNQLENQLEEGKFIAASIMKLQFMEKRKYSDFAVLYRTNAQSNAIELVLQRSGIPYKVLGGQKFFDRKEIKDVIAYLSVINNTNDDLRLKRIINEPKRKIGDATIGAVEVLAQSENKSMFYIMEHASEYTALSKAVGKFSKFVEIINELRECAKTEKVAVVVNRMLEMSGYLDMLSEGKDINDEDRKENVQEFLSNAMVYDQENENPTLAAFLEEIALVSDVDEYQEDNDSVVLMTIHSAKGLEFPVVFLPGLEDGIFPSLQSAMNPDDLEEERRLAYVAITRAKQRLFILCA
ncbi:MAG: UvrD-helicase domain-containing protein, partial [Clostridia bacterium]|nr:UvrD-helicase domain-containing protein [Clostridia bacterium]